jgi:hypothetical protein
VSSRRSAAVHVGTEVVCTWSGECRVCETFCVQPKSYFMWIVLRYRKRARDDLRLVSVPPAMLIFIRIVRARRLQSLEIREVEDLLRVGNELAFFELWHIVRCIVRSQLIGKLTILSRS